jgi:hypothetical protein
MKRKKTFKEQLQGVPQPKKLTADTPLPYVFDLFWDAKTYRALARTGLTAEKLRLLREQGYDTNDLPSVE